MLMADQDTFACSAHAMLLVVFLQALQARKDRGIFFWLVFFRAEGVVRERVEADGLGLIGIEREGEDRRV